MSIEQEIRKAHAIALAALVKRLESFDFAEDCLQEACLRAISEWQKNGVPEKPTGWLIQVGQRIAIDYYRRNQRWDKLTPYLAHEMEVRQSDEENQLEQNVALQTLGNDELLKLIFICCHPAISIENRVALSLKLLMGFKTEEIAKALLQKNKTIEQRITRAKSNITKLNLAFELPEESELRERIDSVLLVIYLIFNEGYCSNSSGHPLNSELCDQAIFLLNSMLSFTHDHAETLGLLALMLGHKAREAARINNAEWVSLEDQNRTLWNATCIEQADQYLTRALRFGNAGKYQLQAAIVAVHNQARIFTDTDWTQILLLYNLLVEKQHGALVEINRAVALWYAGNDADLVLEEVTKIETRYPECSRYSALYLVKGHIYESLALTTKAKAAYENALDLSENSADRKALIKKINHL